VATAPGEIPPLGGQGVDNRILSGLNPEEMDSSHSTKKLESGQPIQPPRSRRKKKQRERFQKGHA